MAVRALRLLPDDRRRRRGDHLPRGHGEEVPHGPGAREGLRAGRRHGPALLRPDLRLPRLPLHAGRRAPGDVDFAEVHDCFTWTEISNVEDLGFCKKGEGGRLVEEGRTGPEGDIPINPSGGLKSFGHPIGASGVRMIYECVTQLRGEAGSRQVKDPELGLAHNVGGPGAVSCVVVLGRS